jgi:hypothetical protein
MAADGKFLSTAIDVSIGQGCILLKAKSLPDELFKLPCVGSSFPGNGEIKCFIFPKQGIFGAIWRNKVLYFSKTGCFGYDLEK